MTRPDRSNLSLLEQDLADLAQPSQREGRFLRELRAGLAERVSPVERPRPRRPWFALRRKPAAVAVAALAVAAAAALVLVGTRETGGPGIAAAAVIAHARQALTPPPNMILHEKLVSEVHGGVLAGGGYSESWQLTSPPYSGRWVGTFAGGPELADDGKTQYVYDGKHTIHTSPDSAPPQLSSQLALLKEELASGRAHVVGEKTLEGESVYEISLPDGYVGYFETKTYRPLFIDSPTSGPSAKEGRKIRMRVVTMEYLRPTPANLRLLSLTAQHPGATVEEDTGALGGK